MAHFCFVSNEISTKTAMFHNLTQKKLTNYTHFTFHKAILDALLSVLARLHAGDKPYKPNDYQKSGEYNSAWNIFDK